MPQFEVDGSPELARALLGTGPNMTPEFDFGFSDEIRLDHAFSLPLLYLRPQHDLPVVPIFTNATAPPMPVAQRFIDLGHYLRRAIGAAPGGRVAIITSAHMAFELGGPRQFSGGSPDPEFDRLGERWLVERDLENAAAGATFERMLAAGNVTHQYMNLLAACAAAADLPLAHGKATMCPHGNEPFFAWGAV
jgi:aromatic ring-opening dioxygenase catalytic subunit (LigB family)